MIGVQKIHGIEKKRKKKPSTGYQVGSNNGYFLWANYRISIIIRSTTNKKEQIINAYNREKPLCKLTNNCKQHTCIHALLGQHVIYK